MAEIDDYLSTPDETFNANVQYWYFEFTGKNRPATDKPFEVFVQALHTIYFFIQDNLNKPFTCVEKLKEVSDAFQLNESEKLLLINKLLGVISNHPDNNKQSKAFIQLVDYRNDLQPYLDEPEIQNPDFEFDFNSIKEVLAGIQTPIDRQKYLINLLLDFENSLPLMDEFEEAYYQDIGFYHWIKTEFKRTEFEIDFNAANEQQSNEVNEGDINKAHLARGFFEMITLLHGNTTDKTTIAKFLYFLINGKEAASRKDYQTILNNISADNKQPNKSKTKTETETIKKYLTTIGLPKEN